MLAALIIAVLALAPSKVAASADVTEAKRLYSIGEQHMAEGHPVEAVKLWRKAVVALPATAAYDGLRHDLVLRLGYGMLVASHETKDRRYLLDATQMLARYLERHERMFGDDRQAKAERGEVYEQLYEIERRLSPPPAAEPTRDAAASTNEGWQERDDDDVIRRKVRVRTGRWFNTTIDDEKTREALASPRTNPEAGLWGTMPELQPITPARAYVRMAGAARPSLGKARPRDQPARQALARAALESVRPLLRECFAEAFTRNPTDVVRTEVELTIARHGDVRKAKVTGKAVIDARGNACVARRLAEARIADAPGRSERIRVPLVFFWKDEVFIDEANGVRIRDELDTFERHREMNHGYGSSMDPIDAPAKLR